MIRKFTFVAIPLVLSFLLMSFTSVSAQECVANSDVNNDGLILSVADMVELAKGISSCGYTMPAPWAADLDGNCLVDSADYAIYNCYFQNGLACLPFDFPRLTCCDPEIVVTFIQGDANGNHIVNVLDITALLSHLYRGVTPPEPDFTGDANGDSFRGILDITYLISFLYKNGPAPQCPF